MPRACNYAWPVRSFNSTFFVSVRNVSVPYRIAGGIWRLVSTRLELVGTGIMATLWLGAFTVNICRSHTYLTGITALAPALAGSLAASEAKSAIIQCFASSSDSTVVGGCEYPTVF